MENKIQLYIDEAIDERYRGSNFTYKLKQEIGLGMSVDHDIFDAINSHKLPNAYKVGSFKPLGIPDGDRPPPKALRYLISDDVISKGLRKASSNVAVIRLRGDKLGFGTGFYITPDTILTAAHVADFFSTSLKPVVWIHYKESTHGALRQTFVQEALVLKGWNALDNRSEADIGLLRLKIPRKNNTCKVVAGKVDIRRAIQDGADSPDLQVSGKTGGVLKLISLFDENTEHGLAKNGHHVTSGIYKKPETENVLEQHLLGGHDIRSYPGWSGAPVLQTDLTQEIKHAVVGVHVHGDDGINLFARFSPTLISELNGITKGNSPDLKLWRQLWHSE